MSKVITFSRVFPAHHPRKGEPTFFVEKIWKGLGLTYSMLCHSQGLDINSFNWKEIGELQPKHHTIRAGNRWKVGDKFSPRVWSGMPYNSKQIIIGPDIEVKRTWTFEILNFGYAVDGRFVAYNELKTIAGNDGLTVDDFECWFNVKKNESFEGQIICWNDKIEY